MGMGYSHKSKHKNDTNVILKPNNDFFISVRYERWNFIFEVPSIERLKKADY